MDILKKEKSLKPKSRFVTTVIIIVRVIVIFYLLLCLSNNAEHLVGKLCVSIRESLNYLFGNVAFVLPLFLLYQFVEDFLVQPKHKLVRPSWYFVIGLLLLAPSLASFFALTGGSQLEAGVVGVVLFNWLKGYMGSIGVFFVFGLLIIIALGLIISVNWGEVFFITGGRIINSFSRQKPIIDESLEKKSKPARRSFFGFKKKKTTTHEVEETFDTFQNNSSSNILLATKPSKKLSNNKPKAYTENLFNSVVAKENEVLSKKEWVDEATVESVKHVSQSKSPIKRQLPSLNLLNDKIIQVQSYTAEQLNEMGQQLEKNLADFNIKATIEGIHPGPVVTLFELSLAPGVRVGQISQLATDLARALAVQSVRIVNVIPGKSYVGVEIPNNERETVNLHQILASNEFQEAEAPLSLALGKDIIGSPVVIDLAQTPHLLVAGTTGSGKSVGINSMILSLLYKSLPEEVKLILIDPKMLELSVYEGIPHLLTPVVTDVTNASAALKWAVAEMERRYKLMSILGCRSIIGMNQEVEKAEENGQPLKDPMFKPKLNVGLGLSEEAPVLEKLPYIVIVIDEFADLMMVVGKQVEELIARLAQKARAAGIHLILATQRPSVNVITGLIKANIPTRLAFQVSTKIDSRTILDQGGAEQLLGLGDMLFLAPGSGVSLRAHGAFVSDEEVHSIANWLRGNYKPPTYIENLSETHKKMTNDLGLSGAGEPADALFSQAWEIVFKTGKASISRVQRDLRIGYNRAARLIEEMEEKNLVSEPDERGIRTVLLKSEEK